MNCIHSLNQLGREQVHAGPAREGRGTWTKAHIGVDTVNNLGLLYKNQGKLDEAEAIHASPARLRESTEL
jgi:hypothetical protein